MRASFAVIAAVAGIASAHPGYGYGDYVPEVSSAPVYTPEPTTSAYVPEYPVEETSTPVYPVESSTPIVAYPTSTPPAEYTPTVPETPVYSSAVPETPEYTPTVPEVPEYTPTVPETPEETICESSTTITVTVPYPSGTGYPPVYPIETPEAPYPTGPAYPVAPYPSGTGVSPPPAGTTGYIKPTGYPTPPEFTGAASHARVGGFIAGVGAFAAFFL